MVRSHCDAFILGSSAEFLALLLLSPMIQRFAVFPASKAPQQVPWLSWSRGAGPPKGPLSSAKGSPRIP